MNEKEDNLRNADSSGLQTPDDITEKIAVLEAIITNERLCHEKAILAETHKITELEKEIENCRSNIDDIEKKTKQTENDIITIVRCTNNTKKCTESLKTSIPYLEKQIITLEKQLENRMARNDTQRSYFDSTLEKYRDILEKYQVKYESTPPAQEILKMRQKLTDIEKQLHEKQAKLQENEEKLKKLSSNGVQWGKITETFIQIAKLKCDTNKNIMEITQQREEAMKHISGQKEPINDANNNKENPELVHGDATESPTQSLTDINAIATQEELMPVAANDICEVTSSEELMKMTTVAISTQEPLTNNSSVLSEFSTIDLSDPSNKESPTLPIVDDPTQNEENPLTIIFRTPPVMSQPPRLPALPRRPTIVFTDENFSGDRVIKTRKQCVSTETNASMVNDQAVPKEASILETQRITSNFFKTPLAAPPRPLQRQTVSDPIPAKRPMVMTEPPPIQTFIDSPPEPAVLEYGSFHESANDNSFNDDVSFMNIDAFTTSETKSGAENTIFALFTSPKSDTSNSDDQLQGFGNFSLMFGNSNTSPESNVGDNNNPLTNTFF